MNKLYCYVDETGKEIGSKLFIVSVIAILKDRESLIEVCEQAEQKSGKGKFKWGKAKYEFRMSYLRQMLSEKMLKGGVFYSVFPKTGNFDEATIAAVFKAIRRISNSKKQVAYIYVDGLTKTKRREYGVALRKSGILIHQIRGISRDESNAITRLADAVAGFIGDALDDDSQDITNLFEKAKRKGLLTEV